ncbi:(Fe-S)-binding protein [Parageobacillus thermoglucosidasius]|uniref:Glycolate oxidase iron-sulfur subunit n=1 Tax=Parageobacillus thermoglucosidasius TaxID=1426 RepID=A0AAN1D8I5_PARTM|nr:(Fe-S)-binding protein [Parageobacillus thermoglucosidasius]ALF12053.1 glycolate oxidase [Parageobacillus thermoglucosidasius]ANZ32142.1 glycolate oxidase [Parageobacillus thermoglucosidasius]APM82873.1 glycolate oxidase [Parageobacillus thermoglucosidasius]KJX68159.1 glycolate oxidase [Parageobacillus thermoglucosidasius]RDE22311.1 (Fe-S)-binding protein [Parageobacillus thermoglucosidasius]
MTESEKQNIQRTFKERMDEDELLNCMRCGFCLPSCPTYIVSGYKESQSPRGRISLMKAVYDGVIQPDDEFEKSLNLCLGCRACEPVCPSGVNYGHLLEEARDIINQNKKHSLPMRAVRNVVFKQLFPKKSNLINITSLVGFYQRSGLQKVARKIGFMKLFRDHLREMEKILPDVPKRKALKQRSEYIPAKGEKKATVAFFTGCLMDTLFLETNNATIQLLQKAGCEIVIPQTQACCGALHGHSGEKELAKELAKQNIEAFEKSNVEFIITNAGGCGAFLMEYDHLLKDDPQWAERAKKFVAKIKDITAILLELDFHKKYRLSLPDQIVTYQDSCHLRNIMKTSKAPRELLRSIKGVTFVEMENADSCCGSAGIYNIVEPQTSMKILDHKMEKMKKTKATTVVTANPGCLMQMKLGIEREGLRDVKAVHIADLLLEATK